MVNARPANVLLRTAVVLAVLATPPVSADGTSAVPMDHHHDMTAPAASGHTPPAPAVDTRLVVDFPPEFKRQELENMRSHLESLQLITHHLAEGDYQGAADVASERLTRGGMSAHDRHQAARYMPKKMLAMGAAMHRAAGHFSKVAQDAAVTGDMAATLKALAAVEDGCVACHRTYRMK